MLNKALRETAKFTELTGDMTIVRVATAYLKDCYGAELDIKKLNEDKGSLPSLSRHRDEVGIVYDGTFYPLVANYKDLLSLSQKKPLKGDDYFVLSYAPEDIEEAESEYVIASTIIADLTPRAGKKVFSSVEATVENLSSIFEYGRVSTLIADGSYTVENVRVLNDGVVLTLAGFTQYLSKKQIEATPVTKGSVLEVKSGVVWIGDVELKGSGGFDIKSIPAEVNFKLNCAEVVPVGAANFSVLTTDGEYYWCPAKVSKLASSIHPHLLTDFTISVTSLGEKDGKKYAVVDVKRN